MKVHHFYKLFFILSVLCWIFESNVLAGIILDEKSGQSTTIDPGEFHTIVTKDNQVIIFYDYVGNNTYLNNGEFEKMRFVYLPRIMVSFEDIEPIKSQDSDYVMYLADLQVDHEEYQFEVWEHVKRKYSKKIPVDQVFAALTGVSFSSSLDSSIKAVGFEEDDETPLNLGINTPLCIIVPSEKNDSFHNSLENGRLPLSITFSFNCILYSGVVDMIVKGSEKEKISSDFGDVECVTEKRFKKVFNANFPRHSEYYFDRRITESFTAKDYEEFEQTSLEKFSRTLFDNLLMNSTGVVISSRKEFEDLDLEFRETYKGYKSFFTDIWDLLHQTSDLTKVKSGLANLLEKRVFEGNIIFGNRQVPKDSKLLKNELLENELLENFKISKDGKILIGSGIIRSGKIRMVSKDAAAEEISNGFKKSIHTSTTKKEKKTIKCEMKLGGGDSVDVSLNFSYIENNVRKNGSITETCNKKEKSIKINLPLDKYESVTFTGVTVKDKRDNKEISPNDFKGKDIIKSPLGWNLKLNTFTVNGEKRNLGITFNWRG